MLDVVPPTTTRRQLARVLLCLLPIAALVLPSVARALPIKELPFRVTVFQYYSNYESLRSLEPQESSHPVSQTRIRGFALGDAGAHQAGQRLKQESIRSSECGYDGNASARPYADDYRLIKVQEGNQAAFTPVWCMDNILLELAPTGAEQNFTLSMLDLDSPLERALPDGTYETLLTDHLMSAIAAIDDAGTEIRATKYGAYGNVRSGASPGSVGYAGARSFDGGRLLFLRNRWYSPELGRFVSRDPIAFEGGFNLYSYSRSNPIRYRDSRGLDVTSVFDVSEQVETETGVTMLGPTVTANPSGDEFSEIIDPAVGTAVVAGGLGAAVVTGVAAQSWAVSNPYTARLLLGNAAEMIAPGAGGGFAAYAMLGRAGGQYTANTCGNAAGQRVLAQRGVQVFQSNIRKGFRGGFQGEDLAEAISQHLPGWQYIQGYPSARDVTELAKRGSFIARVELGAHYVVVDAVKRGIVRVWDPRGGITKQVPMKRFLGDAYGLMGLVVHDAP